ncbi:MAG: ABC transporter ATP-binding protein, partial [Angelakisella sp.]
MAELHIQGETKLPSFGKGPGNGGGNRFKPGARPKDGKGTLLRIIKIYTHWGWSILCAVLLTVVAALVSVAIPYFVGRSLDAFPLQGTAVNLPLLWSMLAVIGALYLSNWGIGTVNQVIMLRVSQKLVALLRRELFSKLQRLPLAFYDTRSHGDTMSRITNDVDSISSTIAQTTTQLVSSVLTLAGSLAVMLSMNLPLTLVVLLSAPMIALLTKVISSRSRAYFLAQSRSLGQLSGAIEESILGFKTVKAFGRKDEVLQEFSRVNEQLFQSSKKAQSWSGLMMPLFNVINNLIFALVALVGGIFSVLYGLSVGTVVSFLSYSKQFGQPLNAIAGMFNTIQSALAGAERVFEI